MFGKQINTKKGLEQINVESIADIEPWAEAVSKESTQNWTRPKLLGLLGKLELNQIKKGINEIVELSGKIREATTLKALRIWVGGRVLENAELSEEVRKLKIEIIATSKELNKTASILIKNFKIEPENIEDLKKLIILIKGIYKREFNKQGGWKNKVAEYIIEKPKHKFWESICGDLNGLEDRIKSFEAARLEERRRQGTLAIELAEEIIKKSKQNLPVNNKELGEANKELKERLGVLRKGINEIDGGNIENEINTIECLFTYPKYEKINIENKQFVRSLRKLLGIKEKTWQKQLNYWRNRDNRFFHAFLNGFNYMITRISYFADKTVRTSFEGFVDKHKEQLNKQLNKLKSLKENLRQLELSLSEITSLQDKLKNITPTNTEKNQLQSIKPSILNLIIITFVTTVINFFANILAYLCLSTKPSEKQTNKEHSNSESTSESTNKILQQITGDAIFHTYTDLLRKRKGKKITSNHETKIETANCTSPNDETGGHATNPSQFRLTM